MPITQALIAQRSGVAQSTVSKILRNPDHALFNQDVRKRVLKAARELGYQVKERRRRTLVYLCHDPSGVTSSAYYTRFHRGLMQAAGRCGFRVTIEPLADADPGTDDEMENICAAIILYNGRHRDSAFRDLVAAFASRMPTVLLNGRISGTSCSSASADDADGIALAMRHVLALGHRRIAFLGSGPDYASEKHAVRLETYRRTLASAGVAIDEGLIHLTSAAFGSDPDGTQRDVDAGLARFLAADQRPTCVVCSADLFAFALIKAARIRGIAVPAEISLTGFDNLAAGEHIHPRLTTIDPRIEELAMAAVEEVERRLRDPTATPRQTVIEPLLIARDSTARPKHPT